MNNDEVIARGGGSPQARWANECCKGGDCPVCNPTKDTYFCEYCERDVDDQGPYETSDGNYQCQDCMERATVRAELQADAQKEEGIDG